MGGKMSGKIKAGVIGTGLMGSTYARMIKTLRDIELVGIMDVNEINEIEISRTCKKHYWKNQSNLFRNN